MYADFIKLVFLTTVIICKKFSCKSVNMFTRQSNICMLQDMGKSDLDTQEIKFIVAGYSSYTCTLSFHRQNGRVD